MPGGDVATVGLWLGEAQSFGWLSVAPGRRSASGVLVLPPMAYAWWSSYGTLRALAEALAREGHAVLRLQYHGTADAAGSQWDPGRLEAWEQSVRDGAQQLRELGCERLALMGAGLGGSLALRQAAGVGADRAVAWRPVVSGRRELRGLRLRATPVPDDVPGAGALVLGGSVLPQDLVAALGAVDLLGVQHTAPDVLLLDGSGSAGLAAHLQGAGARVEHRDLPAGDQALDGATEEAVPALEVVEAITTWLGPGRGAAGPSGPPGEQPADLAWAGGTVRERVVRLTPHALVGVLTEPPPDAPAADRTVVLLNSGSEPHVGPGRAWVELARDLAREGLRAVRVDFRGWGESPDDGFAPGRPYDPHTIEDTTALVEAVREAFPGEVVLAGLCAGAWVALQVASAGGPEAVVALNPQLYWQPGDPVDALLTVTHARRTAEREAELEGFRTGRWDALDRAGERNHAAALLDRLAAGTTRVGLVFAEGDDGLEYLRHRLGRRTAEHVAAGRLAIHEVPGVDHAMHRAWLRPSVFAAIRDAAGTDGPA